MDVLKNIDWFKKSVAPLLKSYEVKYKSFEKEGDLGSLVQAEFNSERIDGTVDFWSLGWIGIHVWDNSNQKELLNILHAPDEKEELESSFKKLESLIL
ncbi:hypothetical protein [Flagellimonas meishanensis]|uniref:hypothetical protein n=1 Tax=Flagellimonas meishanensis TaxID=2873264 RepID=UPI001CA63FDD|nr:hypothetical protein [[Muricauda] meishanensis]